MRARQQDCTALYIYTAIESELPVDANTVPHTTKRNIGKRHHCGARACVRTFGTRKLSSNLLGDQRVFVEGEDRQEAGDLFGRELSLVALREYQQRLVPKNW